MAALVAASPIGRTLEREFGQYLLIRLRGVMEAPPGVVVVAQDYASATAFGLPNKLSGWPRRHLAQVIRQASSAGAQVVVLDIFLDGSQSQEDDIALERAIKASGRVVLVERMRREAAAIGPDGPEIVEERALPPLPRFVAGAYATAPFPLPQGWWRVTAFWAFKAGAEGRATLPAAVLLAAVFADPGARGALAAAAEAESMLAAADLITRAEVPFESRVEKLRQLFGRSSSVTRLVSRIESGTGDPSASRLAAAAAMLLASGGRPGEDNVLWGTDSIWYGSPQDQIQAFRSFRVADELVERHGYPALTPELKAKVFGLNGARVYGVEVPAQRKRAEVDPVGVRRAAYRERAAPVFETLGPRTDREFEALLAERDGLPA
jgi:hypothetical protein